MVVAFILLLFQITQPPQVVRGGDYEITVPHGWTSERTLNRSFNLTHTTGASLRVLTSRSTRNFRSYAQGVAENLANPLGFETISTPQHFSNAEQEWYEYDIRGNRLTDHRRLLYRAIRTTTGLTEIIFENSEERFETLLPEAMSIASSLKLVPRKVRVRQ